MTQFYPKLWDRDKQVQANAAWALGHIRLEAEVAVPALAEAFEDADPGVRVNAAEALSAIGREAKAAVPALAEALKDADQKVRVNAAGALGSIGPEAKAAVPALAEALKDADPRVQVNAAGALAIIGPEAKAAVPDLLAALNDEDERVRSAARLALRSIGDAKTTIPFQYYLLAIGIISYISILLIIFWLRPLWILTINNAIKVYTDFQLPNWLGSIKIPTSYVLLIGFFNYYPRVLSAWVDNYIEPVRERFPTEPMVYRRQVYVSIPVAINQKIVANLTAEQLHSTFARKHWSLLIWGEGGSGKTSLACQIAKWAMSEDETERPCKHLMLPVLIERELDLQVATGKQRLIEAIRARLRNLTSEAESIPEELLKHLLKDRRILVIVDHLSEMSAATRNEIRPDNPDFPINALVVTSRTEEPIEPTTTIKPLRIQGNRLASFMEGYLHQLGKRDLFEDPEYFDACRQLSVMVGKRDITVLLAKLYADQLIVAKETASQENLPDNIPDFMLSYLNSTLSDLSD